MSTAHHLTVVAGNPKPRSRTLTAATTLADALAVELWSDGPVATTTVDLATIADGLLAPWSLSEAGVASAAAVRSADVVILATPTYKASFTGLLKLFLDVLPAGSLSRTVVVPLVVSGGPGHRHLADLQLRPVLSELGAVVPTPSLLIEESELPDLDGITATFVATHGPVLRATTAALLTVPAEKRAAHV